MAITLSRLRTFVALAETKSFHKAASLVGRSQPAVTDQIHTLEETLGIALFHRQTRMVTLTHEGKILFERVKDVLDNLDSVIKDFGKVATMEVGEVRVGATPTLACYILPEVIGSFRKKHPGVKIVFSDEVAAKLATMVDDRQLDFYFGPKPSPHSLLRFRVVAYDNYVIVAPKSHPLAVIGCRDVQDIASYPLLLMSSGTNVRDEIDHFLKRHRITVRAVEEVSNHFTLGGLVEAGCGITLLPRSAHPVIAHPGTTLVDIPDPKFVRVLGVATRADYKPSPAARAFLATMTPLVKDVLLRQRAPR